MVERELLGIVEIEDLVPDSSYVLAPVNESDLAYRIPTSNPGEYFLLECREACGWDSAIGGGGLVVYHVDKSEKMYGGLSASSRWSFNNVNSYALHECLKVVTPAAPADNVGKIFYPGATGAAELVSWKGEMPLKDWEGHSLGIGIVDITFSEGKVNFRSIADYAYDPGLPPVSGLGVEPYQNELRLEWKSPSDGNKQNDGQTWLVRWGVKDTGIFDGEAVADSSCFYIKNLSPDTEYDVQVCSLSGYRYGAASSLSVASLPVTSDFPYIHVPGGGYKVGEIVHLRVLNLAADHISVKWYLNGVGVGGECFKAESAGEYEIKAAINYKDGSYEYIYKNIEVR